MSATRNTLSLKFVLFHNLFASISINKRLYSFGRTKYTRWNWRQMKSKPHRRYILETASTDGCQEIVEIMIKTIKFSIYDYNVALYFAERHGHDNTECIELLKQYGAESIREIPL